MGLLEKLQFGFWDGPGMVAKVIDAWEPSGFSHERDYEKSLYEKLHEEFEEVPVTKQFARGRIRADIVVGDKVIIELKNNFNTTGKYQRLIGQLDEYAQWDGAVFVVLCGDGDANLVKKLTAKIKELDGEYSFDERPYRLFVK